MFGQIAPESFALLEKLPELLQTLMPMSAQHRRQLPYDVAELSALLTTERGTLKRPYWSAPRFVSAYMRYFLPWNLIRLCRFLPHLPLDAPQGAQAFTLLDLGSGPLTLPIALWLSKPAWRALPLSIVCADSSIQPLELGKALFQALAPQSPWQIQITRSPLRRAIAETRERPLFICAANVLNELPARNDAPRAEQLGELLDAMGARLAPGGKIVCIEPGTPLGGSLLEHLRAEALEQNLEALYPCTHNADCPLLARAGRGWCHATMPAGQPPAWLAALTEAAGLGKHSLSLSSLVLGQQTAATGHNTPLPPGKALPARILSEAFTVPEHGYARYGCTAEGLVLVIRAGNLPQGASLLVRPVEPARWDDKSKARVVAPLG